MGRGPDGQLYPTVVPAVSMRLLPLDEEYDEDLSATPVDATRSSHVGEPASSTASLPYAPTAAGNSRSVVQTSMRTFGKDREDVRLKDDKNLGGGLQIFATMTLCGMPCRL